MQRRDFLRSGANLAALGTLSAAAVADEPAAAPLRVALVGCGWYG